ncbi:MAG: LamG-like jellyroll fold domain-containing protein [Nanoarchaeota archaeon]
MDDFLFNPSSPSTANGVQVYTCVRGFGGIGLGLKIEANTATDGSANGEWQWIHHLGTFCYNRNDPSIWPNWSTLSQADGTHLIRATGSGPGERTLVKETHYVLGRRPPPSPQKLTPEPNGWVNSRTVTFAWLPALRATSYQLLVATTPPTPENALCNVTLDASITTYTYVFDQSYSQLYVDVVAINELGSNGGYYSFGIDTSPPSASVTPLPTPTTESQFAVSWSGSDDASGIRWYNIQYRDGNRPESVWVDWKTNTTETAALFSGQPGHTYYFRAQAMDIANNWGDYAFGDGDTHTMIDLNARPKTPWWNISYSGKRNLIILNNDSRELPIGYPVHVNFDSSTTPTASDIYNASLASTKGDDVRLAHQDTTELPRYIQAFAPDRIDIWFNLQAPLGPNPATDSTSYQLYYSNPSASNPPANVNEVLPPGTDANTMGLWHFQEASGTSLTDSSGRGHTGTINNGSRDPDGKFGSAVVFNGSSTTLDLGDHPDFDLRSFTLEGWYYFSPPGTQMLMRREHSGRTGNAYSFGTRDAKVEYGVGDRAPLRSQTQFQPNRWYYVAVTYDGTTMRVFINGREEGSQTDTGGVLPSVGSLIVGNNRSNSDWFSGKMQHIRVSNTARTSFPYGAFGQVTTEPSTGAGSPVLPSGSPDIATQGVNIYQGSANNSFTVTVNVSNEGNAATLNGIMNDLYLDHQPTGPGDFIGSIKNWTASSIDAGQTITLTAEVTLPAEPTAAGSQSSKPDALAAGLAAPQETTHTLYVQADSTGALALVDAPDKNISPPINVCVAAIDAFEGDDDVANAKPITINGVPQIHNISSLGDKDWVSFVAQAGITYTITTTGLGPNADTVLLLYAPDGTTLLATNDDFGDSLASQIIWQAPSDGTYFVQVKHWNPNVGGCGTNYDLSLISLVPPIGVGGTASFLLDDSGPTLSGIVAFAGGLAGAFVVLGIGGWYARRRWLGKHS